MPTQQYSDYINQYQRKMQIHNATHDFTEKDAATRNWHDLKEKRQMTIFERQEKRRKDYEYMKFKGDLLGFLNKMSIVALVGAILYICWLYSNELQTFFK